MSRPPVVTVMGHVDHGKTSLLDALRKTDVVSGEAGGITQHIGAYQVNLKSGQKITFLDTPGHAAFTQMRARGAKVTDLVILVVAADDGVMPQTVEAIAHAKAAGVPMIVAVNKIDKGDANPTRVKTELLQHEIQVEDMGGETQAVEVSATKGIGLDKLEEAILLQAEILDLKANPDRPAEGAVIEAKLDKGRGPVATVLVQRGTLKVGDIVVAGAEWGRVRLLANERGETVKSAGPSTPIEVLGLSAAPEAGDEMVVVENEARAREVAEYRGRKRREQRQASSSRQTLDQLLKTREAGEKRLLPLVLKADVQGSAEAIQGALAKLAPTKWARRFCSPASAASPKAMSSWRMPAARRVIGFNVRANNQARDRAKRDGVEIRYYNIIYNVVDDVKAALSGMLTPETREKFLGNAEILEVFNISKVGKVAGCRVTEGVVRRGAKVRLIRDNVVIHEGELSTLKRFKDEVREVQVRPGMRHGLHQLSGHAEGRRHRMFRRRNHSARAVRVSDVQKPHRRAAAAMHHPVTPAASWARPSASCASGEMLRHALAQILSRTEIRDPDLDGVSVTITQVKPSPDMRYATVYCEPLGGENAQGDHRGPEPPQGISARRDGPYDRHQIHARSALCRRRVLRRSREDRKSFSNRRVQRDLTAPDDRRRCELESRHRLSPPRGQR